MVTPKELGVSYDGNVLMSGDAAMSTGGTWYVKDFAKNAPDIEMRYLKISRSEAEGFLGAPSTAPGYAMLKGGAHEKETAMAINYI